MISIKILIQFFNFLGYNSNEFLVIAGVKDPITLDDNLTSAESNTSNTSDDTSNTSDTNDDDATTSKTIVEIPVDKNHMDDNSSNDEDEQIASTDVVQSFQKMSLKNSRVARAKHFCDTGNVHFNKELRIYNVVDENKNVFMVKLLPNVSI